MPRKYIKEKSTYNPNPKFEPLNEEQARAIKAYQDNEIIFMIGAAGCGKSHLALGMAIQDILRKERSRIIMCRPVVEAGESLGFLPGDMIEKVSVYYTPLFDCLGKICGHNELLKNKIIESYEIAPLAYLRGRSLGDSVCILDEAQNCTHGQLKLFLTRLDKNSKMIITGDPSQIDLPVRMSGLMETIEKLRDIEGIACVQFSEHSIVRHPLVAKIVKRI